MHAAAKDADAQGDAIAEVVSRRLLAGVDL